MSVRGRTLNHAVNGENNYSDTSSSCNGKELDSGTPASWDKRMAEMKQDFTQTLTKVSSKENEKFNLIFSILSELQQRQAQLEESVRSIQAQCQNTGNVGGQAQQAVSVPVVSNQPEATSNGAGNEAMQPYTVMQDGTQAVFTQMVFVQQMPQPMVMQFVGQAPNEEYQQWGNADIQKADQVIPVAATMAVMGDQTNMPEEAAEAVPAEEEPRPDA
mmetsp:Transcript_17718/g.32071  ORF Transcript_17718/g.32071 Transcript_17718/m.32071 type:complete len:216 (+) Transcript_17718:110-757(+)